MAIYESQNGGWYDSRGGYHHLQGDAEKSDKRNSEGSGSGGGGGGCLFYIILIGVVLILIRNYWLALIGIVVALLIFRFIGGIITNRFLKFLIRLTALGAIAWIGTWVIKDCSPKPQQFIIANGTISSHYADQAARCVQQYEGYDQQVINDCVAQNMAHYKISNTRTLVPGEKVKILGITEDDKCLIETYDGVQVAVYPSLYINEWRLRLIPPENFWIRALFWSASSKHTLPSILEKGDYYLEGTTNITDAHISIGNNYFDDESLNTGYGGVKYVDDKDYNNKIEERGEIKIFKTDPAIELDGLLYKYSFTIDVATYMPNGDYVVGGKHMDGFSGTYIVTSRRSFVGEDGRVWKYMR